MLARLSTGCNRPEIEQHANAVLDAVIHDYHDPQHERYTCVRIGKCAKQALPLHTLPNADDNNAVVTGLRTLLQEVKTRAVRPKVVFVCLSISGICVSIEGWRGWLREFVRPLDVELALVLHLNFPEPIQVGTVGTFTLLGGFAKMGKYNLTRVLEGQQLSLAEAEIRF
jgi:hypothetical protein